jgi:DNA-binding NarL/FixJ family response regulator
MESKPVRIFIAEDSHLMLEALTSMIAGVAGTEVAGTTSHAEEAIHKIRQLSPDIAILDIRLETGTGLDVLRAIRSEGQTLPKVIIFSNHLPDSFRRECRALGAD